MKGFINYIFLFLILWSFQRITAQQNVLDSVLLLLKTDKQDTNRVNHSIILCFEYRKAGDNKVALKYGEDALNLAKQLNYKPGIGSAHNNIANIYAYKGDHAEALKNYFVSLKINTELGNKKAIAASYNNIGAIYFIQKNFQKALECYANSEKIYIEIGNKKGIAQANNNIGNIYKFQDKFPEALEKLLFSLKIKEEIGDKKGMVNTLSNIGEVYTFLSDFENATKYYKATLKIVEESGEKLDLGAYYGKVGNLYLKQKKTALAKEQHLRSLAIGKELDSKFLIVDAYNAIAYCDSIMGDFKGAYENYKLYKQFNDSIYSEESANKAAEMSAKYESEKKDNEIKLLNKDKEKQKALTESENKKQKIIIWSVLSGLLLVLIFSVFIYSRWRITKQQKLIIEKQKQLVEEKQKEILDSIHYAKRIQTSLLPTQMYIKKHLNTKN